MQQLNSQSASRPWVKELSGYQWFVLAVCTLGWVFDTMGQQLFVLVRKPGVASLMGLAANSPEVDKYGGYATSLMLIGWATGGIIFGILGDKIGRAKTMVATILIYSIFTGISGLAYNFWDFMLYRFICGLGIGGQFSVGVALVAEYMPPQVRPKALAFMQAMANVGNVTAALISMGVAGAADSWRYTLFIGALPAFLAIPVFRSLKEPESWAQKVASGQQTKKAGSLAELFTDPRWRRSTIVGMILASTGVIGLWGIGFFSVDLNQTVFRKTYEATERANGEVAKDREFVAAVFAAPSEAGEAFKAIQPKEIIPDEPGQEDNRQLYAAIVKLNAGKKEITKDTVLVAVEEQFRMTAERAEKRRSRLTEYLAALTADRKCDLKPHVERIAERAKRINGPVARWAGITSILFNIGGFFGAYGFSYVTSWLNRRKAFAVAFVLAGLATSAAFMFMNDVTTVLCLTPLMGFCIFLIFGGYAVYFPELYPTRLRSTGTSFCYNIGRYVAAVGPYFLGLLSSGVYGAYPEPMRYAGATMCLTFVVGLMVLPFAPETKDKPLPE